MDDKELENLIDKKVAEAKLDVAEKRLNYVLIIGGGLVGLFGILFPLLTASANTDKIDSAISRMDSRLESFDYKASNELEKMKRELHDEISNTKREFNILSSKQDEKLDDAENKLNIKINNYEEKFDEITKKAYRKPELVCFVNGQIIGKEIKTDKKNLNFDLKLLNKGDGVAQDIKAYAYVEEVDEIHPNMVIVYNEGEERIDGYIPVQLQYGSFDLDPKQSRNFSINLEMNRKIQTASVNIILRFLYGQPEPTEYKFKLIVE